MQIQNQVMYNTTYHMERRLDEESFEAFTYAFDDVLFTQRIMWLLSDGVLCSSDLEMAVWNIT